MVRLSGFCTLFTWPGKSKNRKLDVVQQLLNAYFDIKFVCERNWIYHPNATKIRNSKLKADYRKTFNELIIQSEVQFGNMSRWYSDIFKFQTAYSQNLINMGLSIVPFKSLASRIDSNVAYFERCIKELPSAELSITLPILLIGIRPDQETAIINVTQSQFANLNAIIGKSNSDNLYRIINGIINGLTIHDISGDTPIGNRP